MSGWDDTPAPAADPGFTADTGFQADTGRDNDGAFNGFLEENISMHANGDAPHDGGCRVCGEDGHFARDCHLKPANDGSCFNCGQQGHSKAGCTNERVEREFTGQCLHCGMTGHRRADCPTAPAQVCNCCKQSGHQMSECTVNRMVAHFSDLKIKEIPADDAWKMMEQADKDKDVDDIKVAMLTYAKAYPKVTFEELEQVFRDAEMNTYLIAKQQKVADTHTIVNLQGKIDQEFVISIQFSAKPRRAKFAEGWPDTPEENMTRLAKAGIPMDRLTQKCSNCSQLGHGSKSCPEEKVEKDQPTIMCAICSTEGHRARDCTQPRKSGKKSCKNCGSIDHLTKECPEPPNPENVECRKCNESKNCDSPSHKASECPEPRNMSKIQCRNCDEYGHTGRDCDKPTDRSRVECSQCGEKGHTYKRCKAPLREDAEGDGGFGGDAGGASNGGW